MTAVGGGTILSMNSVRYILAIISFTNILITIHITDHTILPITRLQNPTIIKNKISSMRIKQIQHPILKNSNRRHISTMEMVPYLLWLESEKRSRKIQRKSEKINN